MQEASRFLVLVSLVLASETNLIAAPPAARSAVRRTEAWQTHETANFVIWHASNLDGATLGQQLESHRDRLGLQWLGASHQDTWECKCQVVFHSLERTYVQHVGPGSESTAGSSLVDRQSGKISLRRIDVRTDRAGWLGGTICHELTHVILADRFAGDALPRWADEGMAILADTAAKQAAHSENLENSLVARNCFRLVELMQLGDYPAAERWGTFYGQSASLVRFLVDRESPETFVKFVEASNTQSLDAALRECYGISGVAQLEHLWRRHVGSAVATRVATN